MEAEAALREVGGEVDKVKKVAHMKALIVSRTGSLPKAKNNKDLAMLKELQVVCREHKASKVPVGEDEQGEAAAGGGTGGAVGETAAERAGEAGEAGEQGEEGEENVDEMGGM